MFITTNQLNRSYGIDTGIARFFVDREPPEDNLYWHEKLLYLRPAPGYLFIPLIIDLLHRIGIEKNHLLSQEFVGVMEDIGHISALEETNRITAQEAINRCNELVKGCVNLPWLQLVRDYFSGKRGRFINTLATPFPALHRGDVFLFSLSALPFPEQLFGQITRQWFALISTLLLLDDAEDISVDMKTGDSNAFVESGLNAAGLKKILSLTSGNIEAIREVNPIMAAELEKKCTDRFQMPDILHLNNR